MFLQLVEKVSVEQNQWLRKSRSVKTNLNFTIAKFQINKKCQLFDIELRILNYDERTFNVDQADFNKLWSDYSTPLFFS